MTNNQNIIINPTNGTIDIAGASTTFSGVFSGSGSFTISNSGTGGALTLAGANTYTGGTTLNTNADLILSGSLASDVTINSGGQFDNFGSVTASINNAGVFNNNLSANVSGLLTNTDGITTNNGTLNGGANVSGGMLYNNNTLNGAVSVTGNGNIINNATISGIVSNAATFTNNSAGTVAGQFTNTDGNATNNGTFNKGVIVSGGAFVNNGTISGTSSVSGSGILTNNSAIIHALNNAATFNNNDTGILSGLFTNTAGNATNHGTINNDVIVSGGNFVNGGTVTGKLTNTAGSTFNSGALNGGAVLSGGTFINAGKIAGLIEITGLGNLTNSNIISGPVTSSAIFNNNMKATVLGQITILGGDTTNAGVFKNSVQITGGTLTNNNTIEGEIYSSYRASLTNNGLIDNAITNAGYFVNNATGMVSGQLKSTGGFSTNNGTLSAGANVSAGTLINNGAIKGVVGVSDSGSLTNNATITGRVNNAASFINNEAGTVSDLVTNTAGILINNGNFNGGVSLVGGTLTGTGTITGATTIMAGANFVAGNGNAGTQTSLVGSLTFAPGSNFIVSVTPTAASAVSVNGSANLAGTVTANYAPGSYITKQYTIVHATSLSGAFTALSGNQPVGFKQALSYDAMNVYLNLSLISSTDTNLPQNQQNAANAISNYFDKTGSIPAAFGYLTGGNLAQAVQTANATAQNVSNLALGQFLSTVLNPNTQSAAQFGHRNFSYGAIGYADDETGSIAQSTNIINDALVKAAAKKPEQKFAVWSSAYGNYSYINGDGGFGTSSVSAHTGAAVTGLDYYVLDDTIIGFALGGGNSHWTSASGGAGRVDLFQSSFYGAQKFGQAYVSGALGFGNSWVSSNRAINIIGPDVLSASYQAQNYGGRIETGYKIMPAQFSLTPYIAGQFQTVSTPSYNEQSVSGSGLFAMGYNAKIVSQFRGEIGTQVAVDFDVGQGMTGDVFAKLGYARQTSGNQSVQTQYTILSGSYFTLQGARQSRNLALLSLGSDLKFAKNWTFMSKIDTEFGMRGKSYGLTSQLQYRW